MNEPASPRWDRNKPNPEWQNDSEYNPELAVIQKEELERLRMSWEKEQQERPTVPRTFYDYPRGTETC